MKKLVYSVTMRVNPDILDEFLDWMKNDHIQKIEETGLFNSITHTSEISGDETFPTLRWNYYALDKEAWNTYVVEYQTGLKEEFVQKWGEQVTSKDIITTRFFGDEEEFVKQPMIGSDGVMVYRDEKGLLLFSLDHGKHMVNNAEEDLVGYTSINIFAETIECTDKAGNITVFSKEEKKWITDKKKV